MSLKRVLTATSTLFLAAALASSCATAPNPTGSDSDDDDGSGGSGNGSATGGAGGTAAQGGSNAGGAAGGPSTSNCPIDCTSIETDQCNEGVCNEETGQCTVRPVDDGTSCDDEKFCTLNETCQQGMCMGGTPNDCGIEAPACTSVVCEELSKTCTTAPSVDGTPCTSENLCQVNTECKNGLCIGATKDCFFAPVPNECFIAECNPANGLCEPVPGQDGSPCQDPNDLCTENKTCSKGACVGGKAKDCSSLTQGCKDGICNPSTGTCVQQPVPPGGSCAAAADDCNVGICDMNGNCTPQPANEGGSCEDGNQCTTGETCTNGVCSGGMSAMQVIYFQDNFANNNAGWTLDNEWSIGSAQASSCKSYGNEDPAADNTPTGDNGIAGVVLGGCPAKVIHPYEYLTSPTIDLSSANGPVYLAFYRWLNSDYTPYMQNIVEVYDGTQWVKIWESGSSPGVQDNAWKQESYPVTMYKNANFKVRFGFKIGSTGVFSVGSWNVDDVIVANAVCP